MSPDAVSADSERVTVGVAKMELPNTPGLVRRGHGHLEAKLDAEGVHRVDLLYRPEEPRHPHAARCFVEGEGRCVRSPRPLTAPAEEDLGFPATRTREPGLSVLLPLERRCPSKRLEPSETATHVGHVQNRPDGKNRQIAASLQRLEQRSPGRASFTPRVLRVRFVRPGQACTRSHGPSGAARAGTGCARSSAAGSRCAPRRRARPRRARSPRDAA